MTHRGPRCLLVVLAALALSPAPALAQSADLQAPPGLSAGDEYLETIPGGGGGRTVGNGQRPRLDDPGVAKAVRAAVPAATVAALERRGRTGADAAALAGRTAPVATRGTGRTARAGGTGAARRTDLGAPGEAGGSQLGAVTRIATGGEGLGVLFPLLIVGGALAVAGSALWRRGDRSA